MHDVNSPLVPAGLDLSTEAGKAQEATIYTDSVSALNSSGKNQRLAIAVLTCHPDNPREEMDVPNMVASFRHKGFIVGAPVTVSKRDDDTFVVLRGNRRTSAAQWLSANEPETFKRVFSDGKIACLVLTGLSLAEETALLIDHGRELDRRALSKREELRAIRQLMKAGIKGRDAIARALDLISVSIGDDGKRVEKVRSSYVQPRLNLLSLPASIVAKYVAESSMFGGKNNVIKQSTISALYTALSNDRKAGNIGENGFGPELSSAWETLVNTPAATSDAPVKYIAESKAKGLLQEVESRSLNNALTYFGGFSKTLRLSEIDGACVAAESAQVMLADIADCIGPVEFAALCEKAVSAAKAKAAAAAESAVPAAGVEHTDSDVPVEAVA
jgi:hypothetical protein